MSVVIAFFATTTGRNDAMEITKMTVFISTEELTAIAKKKLSEEIGRDDFTIKECTDISRIYGEQRQGYELTLPVVFDDEDEKRKSC